MYFIRLAVVTYEVSFRPKSLAQDLEEVDIGRKDWRVACFVQFLCVRIAYAPAVLSVARGIPLLAGAGANQPRAKAKSPVEEDAPTTQRGIKLDIASWPPPKQVDDQQA